MKKEDLIIKWLDNSLSERELKAFEQLDASSAFKKIDQGLQSFKAPEFDKSSVLAKIQENKTEKVEKYPWKTMVASIAAILVVCLGVYFSYFQTDSTTFFAQNQDHPNLVLPDQSIVRLNSGSEISYNEEKWNSDRSLFLKGEAFFDVEKGSSFTVSTNLGTVRVLGTEFNVISRSNYFEVVCFEGLVAVEFQNQKFELPAGKSFRFLENHTDSPVVISDKPTWLRGESSFQSVPFKFVVNELERQYNVEVSYDKSMSETVLTTNFTHKNLDAALQAITIPLKLSYDLKGSKVLLKSIE